MAKESVHKMKERVRPPRVHISYDVEQGDATVQKELPFVVGVLADLAGNPEEPLPGVRERKFVEIDRDNFDDVLERTKPRVTMKAANRVGDEGTDLAIELNFKSMEDFRPENIARQVEPLAKLLEIRNQLKDLLGRTDGNDRLESMVNAILKDDGVRDKLRGTLGVGADAAAAAEAPAASEASAEDTPPDGESPPAETPKEEGS